MDFIAKRQNKIQIYTRKAPYKKRTSKPKEKEHKGPNTSSPRGLGSLTQFRIGGDGGKRSSLQK